MSDNRGYTRRPPGADDGKPTTRSKSLGDRKPPARASDQRRAAPRAASERRPTERSAADRRAPERSAASRGVPADRRPAGPAQPPRAQPSREGHGEKLQKVLSAAGVASRRAAELLVEQGRVTVDGQVVRTQGMRVDPAVARIEVDGERINTARRHEYYALNKPTGIVTTANDPQGRPTVVEIVRSKGRVYPVGRLDADTSGLLLLTSHGELAHRLTHPKYQVPRVYLAEVRGIPGPDVREQLLGGVILDDGPAKAKAVRVHAKNQGRAQIEITMTEGRKHEVRRMLEAVGHPVVYLARISFGPLTLGDLKPGEFRALSPAEVGTLLKATGL